MKNNQRGNKALVGLFIALLIVAIILALMLVMCGRGGDQLATNPTVTDAPDVSVEDTTQEATESPAEETTEATIPETTEEPTEEPTKETTGGNSRPGGTGGGSSIGGSTGSTEATDPTDATEPTETEPPIEVSEPGTASNAYAETVDKFPGEFTTVVIPTAKEMHYNVYTTGVTLLIEDADTAVTFGGKTYLPEDGVITVPLSGNNAEPASLQIANKGTADKALKILVQEALGEKSNPIVLDSLEQFQVSLTEGKKNGLFYSWTAGDNCTVKLSVDSITPATGAVEIIVNNAEQSYKLSESTDGILVFNVAKEDEITIQVVAQPDAQGSYPATDVTVKSEIVWPIDLFVMAVPGSETTDVIPAGKVLYYNIYGASQTILTIQDPEAWVLYDGQTYTPDENGLVTVEIAPGNPRIPAAMQIGNSGTTDKAMTLNFVYPVGAYGNPEVLTALGDLETTVKAGTDGYYYTYTAQTDGLLTYRIWAKPEGENLKTDIILTNKNTSVQSSMWTYDEEQQTDVENTTVQLLVSKGDEVMILVSVMDTELYTNVDAQVSIEGYIAGTADSAITVLDDKRDDSDSTVTMTTVETPADMKLYYAIPNISDGILTVSGDGSFTVSYNGTDYPSANGTLTIHEVSAVSTNEPAIITIVGDTTCAFELLITFPDGHQMNPVVLEVDALEANSAEIEAGDEDGYFFSWTATEAGELQIVMQDPDDASWQGFIRNKTTGKQLDTVTSKNVKDGEATRVLVMEVNKDDEIEVGVSTYNEENPNRYVAGTVIFSAYLHGTEKDPIVLTKANQTDTTVTYDTLQYPTGVPFYFAIPDAEDVTLVVKNVKTGRFAVGYGETTKNSSSARAGTKITIEGLTSEAEDKTQVFYIQGKKDNSFNIEVTYPAVQQALLMLSSVDEEETTQPTEEATLPPEEEELLPVPPEETEPVADETSPVEETTEPTAESTEETLAE